jgi:hypothetical protein
LWIGTKGYYISIGIKFHKKRKDVLMGNISIAQKPEKLVFFSK